MSDKLVVGIADMKMAQYEGMLVTYALGSCIGICLYDPGLRLAALVHVMLPLNMETGRRSPMKVCGHGNSGDPAADGGREGQGAAAWWPKLREAPVCLRWQGGKEAWEISGSGILKACI